MDKDRLLKAIKEVVPTVLLFFALLVAMVILIVGVWCLVEGNIIPAVYALIACFFITASSLVLFVYYDLKR